MVYVWVSCGDAGKRVTKIRACGEKWCKNIKRKSEKSAKGVIGNLCGNTVSILNGECMVEGDGASSITCKELGFSSDKCKTACLAWAKKESGCK
jgi:hypothetical protein